MHQKPLVVAFPVDNTEELDGGGGGESSPIRRRRYSESILFGPWLLLLLCWERLWLWLWLLLLF